MTTPEQHPVLHFWRLQPEEAHRLDDEDLLEHMQQYSQVVAAWASRSLTRTCGR